MFDGKSFVSKHQLPLSVRGLQFQSYPGLLVTHRDETQVNCSFDGRSSVTISPRFTTSPSGNIIMIVNFPPTRGFSSTAQSVADPGCIHSRMPRCDGND